MSDEAPVPLAEQIRERAWQRAKERSLSLGIEEMELRRAVVEEIEQLLKNHAHALRTRDEALQQHERAMAEREVAFQQRDQMEAGSFHMLERIVKAEMALRLVITQAGIPDPGDACRAIIKTARAALDDAASAAGDAP